MPRIPRKMEIFVESVRPEKGSAPLGEMFDRLREETRTKERSFLMPVGAPTGLDHIVELRIREWMMRMKSDESFAQEAKEEAKSRNKNPPPKI